MIIYIEYFLLQNIVINLCLLRLVSTTTKTRTNFFKLLCASIVGAGFSVGAVTILDNTFIINIIKLIASLAMIYIAYKQNKKQFISNIILLFLYTYAFGGAITSLNSSVYYTDFGLVMTSKFNIKWICIIILICTYVFELIARNIRYKIKSSNLIYPITITQDKNTITIDAYMDTGNLLNLNGQPIIILDINTYLKLTNTNLINFYLKKSEEIYTGTVTGKNNLKIFKIDKIKIKNGKNFIEYKNQLIAVNTTDCFKNTNYKALLSPLLL